MSLINVFFSTIIHRVSFHLSIERCLITCGNDLHESLRSYGSKHIYIH